MAQGRKVTITASDEIAEETKADEAYVVSVEETNEEDKETQVEFKDEEPTSVEDLPDDERIWLDGPTAGQVKLWKQEYGEVYVTSISYDKHIAWRPLSRLEYKALVRKMEQLVQSGQLTSAEANLWNEESISEICVLFPAYDKQSMVKEMAGLPSLIAQEVLEASGFVALEVRQL